jgi:hypothetical protein
MDSFMREELENTRDHALQAISNALQLREYNEEIATCVAYAFLDGVPSAEKIFGDTHLYLLDCYAILKDDERFEDQWLREERSNYGEWLAS